MVDLDIPGHRVRVKVHILGHRIGAKVARRGCLRVQRVR